MNNKSVLYINSKDRDSGTTSNFTYNIYNVGDCYSYYIKNVTIPFSEFVTVYKAKDDPNDPYFLANGQPIYVPAGNYPANVLATLIQTQLNSVLLPLTFNVTYDLYQYLFRIEETSGPTAFTLNFTNQNNKADYQTIGSILGFDNTVYGPATGISSVRTARLSGPQNYFLQSSALNIGSCVSFFGKQQSNTILQIPINSQTGSYIVYENAQLDWYPLRRKDIQHLDFRLVDDFGYEVDLNGLEYTITVVISNRNNI